MEFNLCLMLAMVIMMQCSTAMICMNQSPNCILTYTPYIQMSFCSSNMTPFEFRPAPAELTVLNQTSGLGSLRVTAKYSKEATKYGFEFITVLFETVQGQSCRVESRAAKGYSKIESVAVDSDGSVRPVTIDSVELCNGNMTARWMVDVDQQSGHRSFKIYVSVGSDVFVSVSGFRLYLESAEIKESFKLVQITQDPDNEWKQHPSFCATL